MALLAAIAIPAYSSYIRRAHDAEAISVLASKSMCNDCYILGYETCLIQYSSKNPNEIAGVVCSNSSNGDPDTYMLQEVIISPRMSVSINDTPLVPGINTTIDKKEENTISVYSTEGSITYCKSNRTGEIKKYDGIDHALCEY